MGGMNAIHQGSGSYELLGLVRLCQIFWQVVPVPLKGSR
jgi:hypothetical protein